MFASLSRSWRFATTSYGLLWRNKSLLVFPIFSTLAAALVLVSFAAPLWLSGTLEEWAVRHHNHQALTPEQHVAMYVTLFLFYFCNYFVIVFFNAALVAGALNAIRGEPVSVAGSLAMASQRLPQILGWAAVSAVVGMLLKGIENSHEKGGQIVSGLLGTGWTVMTFFVVPVIVVDGVGPVQAMKNSLSVLKSQWGTALVGNFSLSLLGFLVMLPLYAIGAAAIALGYYSGSMVALVAGVAGGVVLFALCAAVSSAADVIFKALLFSFATGRTLPDDINPDDFHQAFRSR